MQHTCFWNNEILTPIQKDGMDGPGKIAFKKLKILLDRMMLRRTKVRSSPRVQLLPLTSGMFSFNAQTTLVCLLVL
jgi:DNA repair protein RAD16